MPKVIFAWHNTLWQSMSVRRSCQCTSASLSAHPPDSKSRRTWQGHVQTAPDSQCWQHNYAWHIHQDIPCAHNKLAHAAMHAPPINATLWYAHTPLYHTWWPWINQSGTQPITHSTNQSIKPSTLNAYKHATRCHSTSLPVCYRCTNMVCTLWCVQTTNDPIIARLNDCKIDWL